MARKSYGLRWMGTAGGIVPVADSDVTVREMRELGFTSITRIELLAASPKPRPKSTTKRRG